MSTRKASCSCGQLSVEIEGEPIRVSVCHCLSCKLRTGSAFGAQARFPRDKAHVSGDAKQWVRVTDAGNRITFEFCATCGATVHYMVSTAPDVIAVPIGGFADPAFPPPSVSVYEQHMQAWAAIDGDIEHIP